MALHQRWPLLAVFLLSLLVGACEPPLDVQLASGAESLPSPAFVIREPSSSNDSPRYHLVRVSDLDGTLMWAIRARGSLGGTGPARLVYGVVPEGFEETQAVKPLEAGRTYAIAVSGEGRGGIHVLVQGDGRLTTAM